jgi:hypothetical protein
MSRAFAIAILTSGFLAAFAFVPPVIAPVVGPDISNSAHAINLNTSRSNVNRMGGGPGKKAAPAARSGKTKSNTP